MVRRIALFVILGLVVCRAWTQEAVFFNVGDYGAVGDGVILETASIQKAVDDAAESGGGTVYFPPGAYHTETIVLKNGVTLFLDGATLLGSTGLTEFRPEYGSFKDSGGRKFGTALVFARDAEHIGIRGTGVIDGQGFPEYYPVGQGVARPSIIRFIRCRHVRIEDVTMINSAAWVQHYVACEDLTIRDITVRSYSNKNNDGLDIESCQRVVITGCKIDSEDDSIVLKALTPLPCRDVVISDCIVSGRKSAIKIGTETAGNFENISISNCVFYGTRGLTFYTVDGGDIRSVTVSNISMRDSYGVICLRLGDRMRPYSLREDERPKSPGVLRDIMISQVQATGVTENNCFISGIPGHRIENVTLNHIRIVYQGGGTRADSERDIPELSGEYPKPRMFGILPAYGLFVRHARNVTMSDVMFTVTNPDYRSVMICDDVIRLEVDGLQAASHEGAAPFIRLTDTRGVTIRNVCPVDSVDTFLKVEGSDSRDIALIHNDFNRVRHPFQLEKEVLQGVILSRWNRRFE